MVQVLSLEDRCRTITLSFCLPHAIYAGFLHVDGGLNLDMGLNLGPQCPFILLIASALLSSKRLVITCAERPCRSLLIEQETDEHVHQRQLTTCKLDCMHQIVYWATMETIDYSSAGHETYLGNS